MTTRASVPFTSKYPSLESRTTMPGPNGQRVPVAARVFRVADGALLAISPSVEIAQRTADAIGPAAVVVPVAARVAA